MDSSRRILLYDDANSTEGSFTFDANNTWACITNCIGSCIFDLCIPSPPLSPASLPYDGDADTPINLHNHSRLLSILIISASSSIAGSFILVLVLYAYLRRRRRRLRQQNLPNSVLSTVAGDEADLPPGDEIEHHIWYIRTQGLDDITISSIVSFVYKTGDGLVDSKDCSVCLGEFHDGELVRLLPKCSHAFHLSCIDRWLRSHVNCPLCRAPIVAPTATAIPGPSPASPPTGNTPDMVDPGVASSDEAFPWDNNSDEIEIGIVIHQSEGSSSSPSITELPPSSSNKEEGFQPIRRSVSMDFFSLDSLAREGQEEGKVLQEEENRSPAGMVRQGGLLKGNSMQKGPKKMERSLSSQSARWFFPRHGRPRHSVLPL
ncbi:hypothetical protein HPP92_012896 [Vanilla planifolia]|uniref:RING-type E3 ubiquitin transferase n=1 Tax=Vanilla planifolia TaxID=51239 RepID=A0A835UXZ6_VANPL|nr:hypothetical protein HPP92_013350 [Vanilla planifolia]KAG0478177.1 hypothetical protein HPP92_012896 [Vanilla planifolia]